MHDGLTLTEVGIIAVDRGLLDDARSLDVPQTILAHAVEERDVKLILMLPE